MVVMISVAMVRVVVLTVVVRVAVMTVRYICGYDYDCSVTESMNDEDSNSDYDGGR